MTKDIYTLNLVEQLAAVATVRTRTCLGYQLKDARVFCMNNITGQGIYHEISIEIYTLANIQRQDKQPLD